MHEVWEERFRNTFLKDVFGNMGSIVSRGTSQHRHNAFYVLYNSECFIVYNICCSVT